MFSLRRTGLIRLLLLTGFAALAVSGMFSPSSLPASASDIPVSPRPNQAYCDPDGTQASGAKYRICMPAFTSWNGDLVVFAHGYIAPNQPIDIPEDQLTLPDGTSIPDAVALMGYAFAVSSYSGNGLAIRQGLADLVDLVSIFKTSHGAPNHVYLVGVSEGGLITALASEQYPTIFSAGLAACGPVGDFGRQIDYLGDFRVIFDYFFPGLLPGTPISIPQSLMDSWDSYYGAAILPAITDPANAISVTQLLSVTQAAYDAANPATISATIGSLLWYNVFGTNDAIAKLSGQPYNNQSRVYRGSLDDTRLNAAVQRFTADPRALAEVQAYYQTAGRPLIPLVTLHTTLDPVVPYWHESLFREKVIASGRTLWHNNLRVDRYGHCNFTSGEVLQALTLLRWPRYNLFLPTIVK